MSDVMSDARGSTEHRCLSRKPDSARTFCAKGAGHIYDHQGFVGYQAVYWPRAEDEPVPPVPDLYDLDYIDKIPVGPNIDVLTYAGNVVRIRHICKRPRDGATLRIAPALQLNNGGHRIVSKDPFTVEPSIQCEDCGLHGYITNEQWRDV